MLVHKEIVGPLADRTILIVDDEAVVRSGLARLLEAQGAECKTASDADMADKLLATQEFDAAVVDYWLFGETGTSLIQRMRKRTPPTAAVMITGIRSDELASEGIAAGADDILIKPVHWRQLLDKVVGAVERTASWRARLASIRPEQFKQPITHGPALLPVESDEPESVVIRNELCEKGKQVARRYHLSPRETEVLVHVLCGLRNQQIQVQLKISERTVKFHISNIFDKMLINGENRSRSDLILFVLYHEAWDVEAEE